MNVTKILVVRRVILPLLAVPAGNSAATVSSHLAVTRAELLRQDEECRQDLPKTVNPRKSEMMNFSFLANQSSSYFAEKGGGEAT